MKLPQLIPFKWEQIVQSADNLSSTYRAKVLGGWIINNYTYTHEGVCEAMVFISDPNHDWEVK